MNEETRKYRAGNFADLNPNAPYIRLKITASTDEHTSATHWLTITRDELEDVKRLLLDDAVAIRKHWGNER